MLVYLLSSLYTYAHSHTPFFSHVCNISDFGIWPEKTQFTFSSKISRHLTTLHLYSDRLNIYSSKVEQYLHIALEL